MSVRHSTGEGIEHVPREGGALFVVGGRSTDDGRRPAEARALVSRLAEWTGREVADLSEAPANDRAHELLHDGQQLGLVFDDVVPWAVETALQAGVPVVPVVVTEYGTVVLPAVHFEARANQRRYDPAVVGEYTDRVAADLRAAWGGTDLRARLRATSDAFDVVPVD